MIPQTIEKMSCSLIYQSGDRCPKPVIGKNISRLFCHQHVIHEKWWPMCSKCHMSKVAFYTTGDMCHLCIIESKSCDAPEPEPVEVEKKFELVEDDFPALTSAPPVAATGGAWKGNSAQTLSSFTKIHYKAVQTALDRVGLTVDTLTEDALDKVDRDTPEKTSSYETLRKYLKGDY